MALLLWFATALGSGNSAYADEPARVQQPADAMSDEARAHYDRGLALYADKDYPGAIRALEAGYALDPRREFLFAEAQALRLHGDCKSAVPLYQKFLASDPAEVQVNAAHLALSRCAEQMASNPPPANPQPHDDTGARTNTATATATAPPPAPWYHDAAGGALLGAGVLGLATGTIFTVAAMTARDDANHAAQSYPDYARFWNTARSRSQIAIAGFAAGAALAGAGIVRYLRVHGRRPEATATPASATIDAWIAPGGARAGGLAGVEGRF